ncbi:MAG TPA: sigma-70 family RNA polymerase sigma factor [archaeon]|nr:sigma-70 family RNA polymerase sigma factor [archaeon]
MSQNYQGLFQDWEIAVAKKLVDEFQGKWTCLEQEDFDDLLQECLTKWFFTKDDYNPSRETTQKTFMGRIIRNKLTDLVREREADKRKINYLTVSLDEPVGNDENAPTLIDKIDECVIADAPTDPFLEIQLKIDLPKVLKKLAPHQKKLCRLLGEKGFTVKEASEYLKTPRSTIYGELKRIRTIFMKEGLEDYIK